MSNRYYRKEQLIIRLDLPLKLKKRWFWLSCKRSLALLLIILINYLAINAIGNSLAYFSDEEKSEENLFQAATLDLSLNKAADFAPFVTPATDALRSIKVANAGSMGVSYDMRINILSPERELCEALYIDVYYENIASPVYSGQLINFNLFNLYLEASTTAILDFQASLADNNYILMARTCEFNLLFDGESDDYSRLPGFFDEENKLNIIRSGQWGVVGKNIVINKIYYDVDSGYGREVKNEWIELYNPNSVPVSLKKWEICNHDDCEVLDPQKEIPPEGYALISHDSSTWKYWPVPDGVVIINQLGGKFIMNNNTDMLILRDSDGFIMDEMNWGAPDYAWDNASSTLWNPGAKDAGEGHMLGRVPTGHDTDQANDWFDLKLPEVELISPDGNDEWKIGATGTIVWIAENNNGLAEELGIDLYYSNSNGASWVQIADNTENDGEFIWTIPETIGDYDIASKQAMIKVTASGPENFLVYDEAVSEKFSIISVKKPLVSLRRPELEMQEVNINDENDDDNSGGKDDGEADEEVNNEDKSQDSGEGNEEEVIGEEEKDESGEEKIEEEGDKEEAEDEVFVKEEEDQGKEEADEEKEVEGEKEEDSGGPEEAPEEIKIEEINKKEINEEENA